MGLESTFGFAQVLEIRKGLNNYQNLGPMLSIQFSISDALHRFEVVVICPGFSQVLPH